MKKKNRKVKKKIRQKFEIFVLKKNKEKKSKNAFKKKIEKVVKK